MKRKKIFWSVAAVGVIAVIAATAFVLLRPSAAPEKKALKVLTEHVDLEVKNVLYTEIDSSNTKWEIRADSVRYVHKKNQAFFEKVRLKLQTADGKVFTMSGDKGKTDTETRDMELTGHVEVQSQEGDTFQTDYLSYTHGDGRIVTDAPVIARTSQMRIQGVGMTLSLKEQTVTLLKDVKARIRKP